MKSVRTAGSAAVLASLGFALGCAAVPIPGPTAPDTQKGTAEMKRDVFLHDSWDAFVTRHVDADGSVDYAAAVNDRPDLDVYLAAVAAASPDSAPERFPTRDARLAYWINAYNAWVVAAVLDSYPVNSVREIRGNGLYRVLPRGAGFFLLQRITLGGTRTSLYYLENQIVRKRFADPRIHFALNCASLGCPKLPQRAFRAETLQADLDRETRRFVGESRNVRVDPEVGTVFLSSIFDWYESDFTDWMRAEAPHESPTLLGYVGRSLDEEGRKRLAECTDCRVEFAPYDWWLNDQAGPGREEG